MTNTIGISGEAMTTSPADKETHPWLATSSAYLLPCIVEAPEGKIDISEWAAREMREHYWLELRSGTRGWNAKMFVPERILLMLDHGKTYQTAEICPWLLATSQGEKMPDKVQFIVEKLV